MSRTIDVGALLDGSAWTTYQKLLTALAALAFLAALQTQDRTLSRPARRPA